MNLDDDRRETLQMLLEPIEKYLVEVNDPFANDEKATIPMEQLKQFAELGGFGALVPEEYEGAGLNNTQMTRLAETVGGHDLGLGIVMGAHQVEFCIKQFFLKMVGNVFSRLATKEFYWLARMSKRKNICPIWRPAANSLHLRSPSRAPDPMQMYGTF